MSDHNIFDLWDGKVRPHRSEQSNVVDLTHHVTPPSGTSSYAAAALRGEADEVAATGRGKRNQRLNKAWFNMGRHIGAGTIDIDTVRAALTNAGLACGLPAAEVAGVLRDDDTSGARAGSAVPRHPAPLAPIPGVTVLEVPEPTSQELDAFWESRDMLTYLHDFARARRVSPWALLGVTLARVITAVPHFVVLPAIVGGQASLNLFIGLVGRSGTGKGAAESAAAEALDVGPIAVHKTGSGEGIAHSYMRREKGEIVQHEHACLFSVPEIDTLTALGDRRGSTLLPELRSAWSGETLGFQYADPTRRLPVPAHEYRLCMVTGIQPGRARALLEDADGGTPQRFIWMPATDPDAPDVTPPVPPRRTWQAPDTRPRSSFRTVNGRMEMTVCEAAVTVIDAAVKERLRGVGDALDGHALLARLKAAAALACLEGRLDVTDEDWELAEVIQRKSDATRASIAAALSRATADANNARAEAEAGRAVVVAERVGDAATKRVCGVIVRKLRREADWVLKSDLRRTVGRDRKLLDEALERLMDAGQIEPNDEYELPRFRIKGGLS